LTLICVARRTLPGGEGDKAMPTARRSVAHERRSTNPTGRGLSGEP